LGSLRETWIKGVSEAREGKRVAHAVEHGPWTPPQALEQGLIDHVGYASQARDAAKKSAKTDTVKTASGLSDRRDAAEELSALLRSLAGSSSKESHDAHIVVLPVAGAIAMDGGNGVFGSGGIAARPLTKTLRRLAKDKAVKAVVLRIDSPGGSALASDLLWHELMLLRDKKPLIVSLAGTAASGGYYMACAGHAIVSERTTVLGSIGVFGGKVVVGDTLDEFGVSAVTFAASSEEGAGARAAYLSPLTEWDEATRGQVRAQMANIYDLFLARVAEGRGLEVAEVHKVAQGRIWSGVQGKEHALVDELGGLWRAIELAREKADLKDSVPVKVEKGPETLLELLQLGDDADEEAIGDAIARLRQLPPGPLSALAKPLMPHVASLAPLLGKERVLVAMPFALTIE
jgi:protease-4